MFLPWPARPVGLPNGRVAADGSPERTDDGRVVRDFKLEPTTHGVKSRNAVPRAVYWFERGGFLVSTGMLRPVLGDSCTTSIKDFAIFPFRQKEKKKKQLMETVLVHNFVTHIEYGIMS